MKTSHALSGSCRQVPVRSRAIYEKAMSGRSRKAAMRVFCLECCGWQVNEVFECTDVGCPLYPYRPTSRTVQGKPERQPEKLESTNSDQLAFNYGPGK